MYHNGLYYEITPNYYVVYNFGNFVNIDGNVVNVDGLQLTQVTNVNFDNTLAETKRQLQEKGRQPLLATNHPYVFFWNSRFVVYDALCDCFVYPMLNVTQHNPFNL